MAEPLLALQSLISQLIIPHRRHSSTTLINRLVADIWAVQLELRSACLLDGIAISQEQAVQIADGLQNITCLVNLVVLHQRLSCSTFICSRSLWKARYDPAWWKPICIDLSSTPPQILDHIPQPVMCALKTCEISGQLQASNRVVVELQPASTLVSLAGLFLGYPCTYCNCSTNQIVAGPLKVVQVDLLHLNPSAEKSPGCILPSQHQLMAFTFPAALDYPGSPLELEDLIKRLKHHIEQKLRSASAGCSYGWEGVEIKVEQTVNIERVAL